MTDGRLARLVQSTEAALKRAAGSRAVPGNRVSLLVDGPDAYEAMKEVIRGAERWIHFENYIIRSDSEGWAFAELLASRARDGVAVRVLYDWLGSFGTRRRYWKFLRDAGCEVRAFHRFRFLDIVHTLARDHRKLVVADGRRAVVGGLCIGCEWTGNAHEAPWRDTAVDIAGPAASVLDHAFAQTWAEAGGTIPDDSTAGAVNPEGNAEVRVIAGRPGREHAFRTMELLTIGATERLWITDAYLLAPARLFNAFRDAARDNVDVRLLVPGTSDIPFVRNLTRIGYRALLRSGVRIFEWEGPMLHAKSSSTDGRWVRVGSSNLNPASLVGNYELDVLIDDPALAEEVDRQFRLDIARSREVSRRQVRGPARLSGRLPMVLTRLDPETPGTPEPSFSVARRRTVVALRGLTASAQRSVFLPLMLALALLAVLFFFLPRATSFAFALLCTWLAVSAGREAFRRRADR